MRILKQAHTKNNSFDENQLIQDKLILFLKHCPNCIDTIISDETMKPIFEPKDFVAGIQAFGYKIDIHLNQNCIIKTLDKRVFVRLRKPGTSGYHYDLYTIYPQ